MVIGCDTDVGRLLVTAGGLGHGAAPRKRTARRHVAQFGHVAGNRRQPRTAATTLVRGHAQLGPGTEKSLRVRVGAAREHLARGAAFHHHAAVHHHHAADVLRNDAEVVRNQDQAHGTLANQVADQLQDLPGDGHVQRRGGFVGDQEVGPAGKGHRNRDALTLAPRELVRPGVEAARCVGDADPVEKGHRLFACRRRRQTPVQAQRFGHLVADGVHRIEGRHRLLEHHGDAVTAQCAPACLALPDQFLAMKPQAARHRGTFGLQSHQRHGRERFAAPRFTDQAQCLATAQSEAHTADCIDRAGMGAQAQAQVGGFEEEAVVAHRFTACGSVADPADRAARRRAGSGPARPGRWPHRGTPPASGSGTARSEPR